VRHRFARHIAVLILIDACASAIGFYLFGFAFAFGDMTDDAGNVAGNSFIGSQYFALHNLNTPTYFTTNVRPYAFWVFEWAVSALLFQDLQAMSRLCSVCFRSLGCCCLPAHCLLARATHMVCLCAKRSPVLDAEAYCAREAGQ
jgi:hypothetical protein